MDALKTETITLAKALSVKNRLSGRLARAKSNIQTYNSVPEGGNPADAFDVRGELELYRALREAMIRIKAVIQRANLPVVEEILRIGELKAEVKLLNELNTKSGPDPIFGGGVNNYVACLSKTEVLGLVRSLEVEIDQIQDRLNEFNAVTRVEVAAEVLELAR